MGANVSLETSIIGEAVRYGLVGLLVVVFGLVIKYLYQENRAERKAMDLERQAWQKEKEASQERHAERINEIREESNEYVEKIAKSSEKANDALVEMLQQFLDKLVK